MEQLNLIYRYKEIDSVDNLAATERKDCYSELVKMCAEEDIGTVNSLNQYLLPVMKDYMSREHMGIQGCMRHNKYNYRRYYTTAVNEVVLKQRGLKYKKIDDNKLEVYGLPTGFYSAYKTIERAIRNNVDYTKLSKTEVDKAIKIQKEQNAPTTSKCNMVLKNFKKVIKYAKELGLDPVELDEVRKDMIDMINKGLSV